MLFELETNPDLRNAAQPAKLNADGHLATRLSDLLPGDGAEGRPSPPTALSRD